MNSSPSALYRTQPTVSYVPLEESPAGQFLGGTPGQLLAMSAPQASLTPAH